MTAISTRPALSHPTWKSKVPLRYRRRFQLARVVVRQRTDRARPLPGLLVIGGQRCGTSSMYKYLESHPALMASIRKETDFFSLDYAKGEGWYRAHFPSRLAHRVAAGRTGVSPVAFEASPYYLFHPLAPARAARHVPDARLVVLLRDPVERAWSHYLHEVRGGRENRPFVQALDEEEAIVSAEERRLLSDPRYRDHRHNNVSYATKGRYAEQLERWFEHFPRERVLILRTEDLFVDPAGIYQTALRFLGLPDHLPRRFANHSYPTGAPERSSMPGDVRQRLAAEFEPYNRKLYALLGLDLGWSA